MQPPIREGEAPPSRISIEQRGSAGASPSLFYILHLPQTGYNSAVTYLDRIPSSLGKRALRSTRLDWRSVNPGFHTALHVPAPSDPPSAPPASPTAAMSRFR